MSKRALIKRLGNYYPMEGMHAFFNFPILAIYLLFTNSVWDILFLIYGLLICIFILIQGQHYWKLKLYRLTGEPFDQTKNLNLFKLAKRANVILIALIPVALIVQLRLSEWSIRPQNLFGWAILANCFAILEYVNYYHIQLMIDNKADLDYLMRNRRLKISSLRKDISDNEI